MDRATQYAKEVVKGKRIAGELEILACKRHLNDLERQGTDEFPYVWDIEKANDIQEFAETLTLAEGEEPAPLNLYDFQCFVFGNWNGWVHKDTGYRRFRTSYMQVARQNGKSLGNAVPTLYYGNFSGYQYPQIYAVATKEQQAKIVLKECYKFINADKELSGTKTSKGLFTIKDYKSEIECNLTSGVVKALGRDTESIDGFRPFFASVDEYHKHKTNQMYKLMSDGTKKLKQCLVSVITTAGFELNTPCKALYDYCVKVLKRVIVDETQFIFICQLDKDDDQWDETNWPKSNPLWTPETLESIKADAVKAREMGGEELRNFLTKDLNMWVQLSEEDYIDLEKWKECESELDLEDMQGKECVVGLDLSSGGDLTSLALEFPVMVETEQKYFIHSHSFMPKMRVAQHIKSDDAPYDIWVKQGLLTLTETLGGLKTDYKYIIRYLKELKDTYNFKFKAIAYDPYNADTFLADLEEFGCDCVEIVQSARSLSPATEDFKLEVDANNILYNKNNGLLNWSVINAKLTWDSFRNQKIDKTKRTKRVDPIDAIIDAHKVILINKETEIDINESTEDYLKMMGW
ncbi:terminase TerL endonuclease subunit [Priestia megaterium]|uniref:terminase large subunit n=1 Tax=Priestia megaterium TaxID=1404 RepID=UPI002FFE390D